MSFSKKHIKTPSRKPEFSKIPCCSSLSKVTQISLQNNRERNTDFKKEVKLFSKSPSTTLLFSPTLGFPSFAFNVFYLNFG